MSNERWLPEETQPVAENQHPPWVPRTLEGAVEPDELADSWGYVVVDEIVGGRIGLSIAQWPGIDDRGRLHFPESSRDELLGTSLEQFQAFVDRGRVVLVLTESGEVEPGPVEEALRHRRLRIGDAFAISYHAIEQAKSEGRRRSGGHGRADAAFGFAAFHDVYDISREAREQAKLAGAAAVAPVLDPKEAERFLGEEEPPDDGPDGEEPEGEGPGGSQPPAAPAGSDPGAAAAPREQVEELKA